MLKKFLLNALSSFVGAWVAFSLFGIAALIVIISITVNVSGTTEVEKVKKHSVAVLDLNGSIIEMKEAGRPDYMSLLQGDFDQPQSLAEIVNGLKEASENKNIEALYIKCGYAVAAPATMHAIRDAVKEFKKSGKKIYAYADNYTLGSYFVASVADKIILNPYGEVAIQGIGSTSLFMKGLYDKLGIEFQVVKVGTFKSAVEPYISTEMSGPARAQLDTLYGAMWAFMKDEIVLNRKKLSSQKIDSLVNDGLMFSTAEKAKMAGFVDEIAYERTIDGTIADLLGVDKKKVNYVSMTTLAANKVQNNYSSKNQIAVLYATGEIADGAPEGINFQKLVPLIVELADDEKVKGLVLRVNSPGGSAYGSDQIGEALDYFKSKNKPLSVSMGDYAASGGYWISCGADKIYADPLTITGSIGIFGLIPNGKGLIDKLGINPQTVSTNPESNFPSFTAPMTSSQLAIMQEYVERGYDRFITRVSNGRKMKPEQVRGIAEGRVWNAMKAKEIGLVDSIGSLEDAIEWTAKKCGLEGKYDVATYPMFEPGIWDLLMNGEFATKLLGESMTNDYKEFATYMAKRIFSRSRIQARMPEVEVFIR